MKVIVPTCKTRNDPDIIALKEELGRTVNELELTVTGWPVSASINRNYGMYRSGCADDEIIIMVDDDITGLFDGWAELLTAPLIDDPNVLLTSARLMTPDGKYGTMVGDNYTDDAAIVVSAQKQLPTACVAFRNLGCRFDESYIGSGFEDNDFCHQLMAKNFVDGKFLIINTCQVIHKNHMKNQGGEVWEKNKAYYKQKWGIK